jgi:flagellar hook-basal body complex protein FliE
MVNMAKSTRKRFDTLKPTEMTQQRMQVKTMRRLLKLYTEDAYGKSFQAILESVMDEVEENRKKIKELEKKIKKQEKNPEEE